MKRSRDRFTGFPIELYRRTPFWYWKRYIESDCLRLALGGRYYGEDFWFRLNRGWFDMQP